MPAAGQRACRGHRDGDALDGRGGGIRVDGVGLPGVPGPRRRGRAASLAGGRSAPVAAADRDHCAGARAGWPVHRRAPGLARSGPRADGALRRADRRHEPGARRLATRGAHRRRHRRGDRRSGVDAHAGGDPGPLRGGRRTRRRPRARERRALPARQSLLGRRSGRLRAGVRAQRARLGRAADANRVRARGRGPRPGSPRRLPPRARGPRRERPRPLSPGLHRGPHRLPQGRAAPNRRRDPGWWAESTTDRHPGPDSPRTLGALANPAPKLQDCAESDGGGLSLPRGDMRSMRDTAVDRAIWPDLGSVLRASRCSPRLRSR